VFSWTVLGHMTWAFIGLVPPGLGHEDNPGLRPRKGPRIRGK